MGIREQYNTTLQEFFEQVALFFQNAAIPFGFPENPGMPLLPEEIYSWNRPSLKEHLPIHQVQFPPEGHPTTYIEVLLGTMPKPGVIPRIFYENKNEGFYNFYIPNYKNIFFLPNQVSEFLQIKCKFCTDISYLELSREVLFMILVGYYYLIGIRMFLAWLVAINPYTLPFSYIISLVDWVDEVSTGIIPSIGGTNYAMAILTAIVGKIADSLNHLVFTMPFLPSEGVPAQVLINGEAKHVLIFRYLPYLWYKYPIPNEIRKFWYYERPDILQYMEKQYGQLDINLLPDPNIIVEQVIDKFT